MPLPPPGGPIPQVPRGPTPADLGRKRLPSNAKYFGTQGSIGPSAGRLASDRDEDDDGHESFPQTVRRLRDEAKSYLSDLLNGAQDTPQPGKAGQKATEEALEKFMGTVAKRVFIIGSNLVGDPSDPTGRSEPPPGVGINPRSIRPTDLPRFTDQALLKVIVGVDRAKDPPQYSLDLQRDARALLAQRAVHRAHQARLAAIAQSLISGTLGVRQPYYDSLKGGSDKRDEQANAVLDAAGVLGQLTRTIVFPGWAGDP